MDVIHCAMVKQCIIKNCMETLLSYCSINGLSRMTYVTPACPVFKSIERKSEIGYSYYISRALSALLHIRKMSDKSKFSDGTSKAMSRLTLVLFQFHKQAGSHASESGLSLCWHLGKRQGCESWSSFSPVPVQPIPDGRHPSHIAKTV